jgi:hypothetical protein
VFHPPRGVGDVLQGRLKLSLRVIVFIEDRVGVQALKEIVIGAESVGDLRVPSDADRETIDVPASPVVV